MRCTSYCTAKNYDLAQLANWLRKNSYQVKFYREVLHITQTKQRRHDIFCFPQGCVVFWNLRAKDEQTFLQGLTPFSTAPLDKFEMDSFSFRPGEDTKMITHERFNVDIIQLDSNNLQTKLAVSYGLAQSVRLATVEESIKNNIATNSNLATELASTGKIKLRGKEISKRMGEIFIERSSVNLNSEYLEMPEYFWKYPSLELYYLMVEKYLDVPRRVNALNRKLDVLHDIIDMLNNQLQHRYSSILETIIIALIAVEIFMNLFDKWWF